MNLADIPTSRAKDTVTQESFATVLLQGMLFALLLVALPNPLLGYDRYALPKEFVLELAAFMAVVSVTRQTRLLEVSALDLVLLAFVLWAAAGAVFALNRALALRAVSITAGGATLFWISRVCARREGPHAFLAAIAGATTAGALLVLLEAHFGLFALSMSGRAPGSTEGNRNFMAHLMVLGLPAILLLSRLNERSSRHWISSLGLLLCVWALVIGRCRAAWIAGAVELLLWFGLPCVSESRFTLMQSGRKITIVTGVAIGLGAVMGVLVPNRLVWKSEVSPAGTVARLLDFDSGTGHARQLQWERSMAMVRERPLVGVGPGNWSVHYPRFANGADPNVHPGSVAPVSRLPNSDWMGVLAETGLIGILLCAIFGILLFRRVWSLPGPWATAGLVGLAGCLLLGWGDAALLRPEPLGLVAVFFGSVSATAPAVTWRAPGRPILPLLGTSLCLALLVYVGALRLTAAIKRGDESVPELEAALRIDRGDYRLTALLAHKLARGGNCERARALLATTLSLFPYGGHAHMVEDHCAPHMKDSFPTNFSPAKPDPHL